MKFITAVQPRLTCPDQKCRGSLMQDGKAYRCERCGKVYPINDGIPTVLPASYDLEISARYERGGAEIDAVAASVGYLFGWQHRLMRDAVVSVLSDLPAASLVLDVGCGHGKFTSGLTARHHVVGVDLAHSMLRRARDEGLDVYQADATALPFADGQFDAVVCAEVVQHFSDLAPAASEFARVLKPGGRAVVTTLNRTSLLRRINRLLPLGRHLPTLRTARELSAPFAARGLIPERILWTHFPVPVTVGTRGTSNPASFLASNVILCTRRG